MEINVPGIAVLVVYSQKKTKIVERKRNRKLTPTFTRLIINEKLPLRFQASRAASLVEPKYFVHVYSIYVLFYLLSTV